MPRQQEHQETKTVTDKDGGGKKKKKSHCGRKSGSQGGGKRKKDGGCRRRQTEEMKSVPRGARVLTNTEKEFYKQQSHTSPTDSLLSATLPPLSCLQPSASLLCDLKSSHRENTSALKSDIFIHPLYSL